MVILNFLKKKKRDYNFILYRNIRQLEDSDECTNGHLIISNYKKKKFQQVNFFIKKKNKMFLFFFLNIFNFFLD